MDQRVLVFQGSAWQATQHQTVLEASGIEVTSIYLPTVEGHELYVDVSRAAEAQRLVHEESTRLAGLSFEAEDGVDPELGALRVLGHRVRACALSIVGAPAGLVLGIVYFARAARNQRKPAGHADTVLAWTACWLFSIGIGMGAWIVAR